MNTNTIERNKETVNRLFEAFRAGDTDAFDRASTVADGIASTMRSLRTNPQRLLPRRIGRFAARR
jgi:ketosteroid isomerase-like protein